VRDGAMPKKAMEIVGCPGTAPVKASGKVKNCYLVAAVAVFNSALLFVLLNLVLYPIMLAKQPVKVWTPMDRWGLDNILRAYPGWQKEDVKTLITETYRSGHAFEYEPFTGFRERPFRGKYVNIDSAGFRISKDQAPWPPRPQAMNVFLFGGSTTFGYGLPDDQTIASYLGECGLADGSHGRLAVYNFGQGSYFSSQELILFQQLLKAAFVPQVAVFIDGINEFDHADGQPRFTEALRRVMDGEVRSSPFDQLPVVWAAYWLRDHWTKLQPQKAVEDTDRALLEGVTNRWLANKRMIELMADSFGVRTIFVWQPVPMYKYDLRYHLFYSSDKVFGSSNVRNRDGYPLMENLRAKGKLGPDVLWLADMQQDKRENLYVDAIHYNATFSKEIAAQICGFLTKHANVGEN